MCDPVSILCAPFLARLYFAFSRLVDDDDGDGDDDDDNKQKRVKRKTMFMLTNMHAFQPEAF